MTNDLQQRADLFSKYIGSELKGAIASHGYSQGKVADALGHARSAMSNWLNAKPPIDVSVAEKVCDYIGIEFDTIVRRAQERVNADLPSYPQPADPTAMSDEEQIAWVNEQIAKGGLELAANRNPDKRIESETPRE